MAKEKGHDERTEKTTTRQLASCRRTRGTDITTRGAFEEGTRGTLDRREIPTTQVHRWPIDNGSSGSGSSGLSFSSFQRFQLVQVLETPLHHFHTLFAHQFLLFAKARLARHTLDQEALRLQHLSFVELFLKL